MADNWQLKAVLSAVDKMSPVLKNVGATAKSTRKYLLDVGSAAGNLAGRIGVPVALISSAIAGLSVAGLKKAVSNFAELGDRVAKSATRIGVSTDEFQRLDYIAGQSGVSVDGLGSSMGRLNKSVALAVGGKNKDLAALFKRTGISMRDAKGDIRSAADLLPEVAELFARNKNAAVQARMGNAIFGKGWQELAPLLNGGKKGIEELTERYDMLGLTIDEKSIKAGEAFGDQLEDLHSVTSSYGNLIGAKLIPLLSPLVEQLIKWAVANREIIATKVAKFVEGLAKSLEKVDWNRVIDSLGRFVDTAKWVIEFIGGIKVALIGLVLFMNAGAIVSFFQLAGAVFRLGAFLSGPLISAMKLAWLVMSACPVLVIAAAIVALAVIVYQNWDKIVAYVQSAWQRIKNVFDVNFFSGLIQLWLEGWQALANGILGIIKTITPDFLMPKVMKDFQFTFATDRANRLTSGDRPSLAAPQQRGRVDGQIDLNITGLAYGARVEAVKTGGNIPVKTNVGYRGYALDH